MSLFQPVQTSRAVAPRRRGLPALTAAAGLALATGVAVGQTPTKVVNPSGQRDLSVTVYNQNLALVHEERAVNLPAGRSEVRYADVAAQLDPTSVHLVPARAGGFQVLEQNFQYDLASADRLLERSLGNTVRAVSKDGNLIEGKLVYFDGGALVLETGQGVRMVYRHELREQSIPNLPGGLVSRPTLAWLVEARGGNQTAELSYLTTGMSWHAEYVAVVTAKDDALSLAGWVSVENHSGATYPDAKLKLVAGDINLVRPRFETMAKGRDMIAEQAAPPQPAFAERGFFEYHLYDLQRRTTLADRETKQISLFDPADVRRVEKKYTFDASRSGDKVVVTLEFKNARDANLGMPLPAGKVRIYKRDTDGTQQFVGEDLIDHTPRDEEVRLTAGKAFDVVAERKQTDFRRLSDRVYEQTVEVELRNRKDEAVTVLVVEHPHGDWEITARSHPFEKKDATTVEFPIRVGANQTVKLSYTIRTRS